MRIIKTASPQNDLAVPATAALNRVATALFQAQNPAEAKVPRDAVWKRVLDFSDRYFSAA